MDSALRRARALGTGEMSWLNLQTRHDLDVERDRLGDTLERDITQLTAA